MGRFTLNNFTEAGSMLECRTATHIIQLSGYIEEEVANDDKQDGTRGFYDSDMAFGFVSNPKERYASVLRCYKALWSDYGQYEPIIAAVKSVIDFDSTPDFDTLDKAQIESLYNAINKVMPVVLEHVVDNSDSGGVMCRFYPKESIIPKLPLGADTSPKAMFDFFERCYRILMAELREAQRKMKAGWQGDMCEAFIYLRDYDETGGRWANARYGERTCKVYYSRDEALADIPNLLALVQPTPLYKAICSYIGGQNHA